MMFKTLPALAALAVAGSLVVPTVSIAAEKTSARVSYADLNLATDQGKSTLDRRVAFAADALCGVGKWKNLGLTEQAAACSSDTIASAQPAVNAAIAAARRGSVTVLEGSALIVTVP
jgi:UrcA family protein